MAAHCFLVVTAPVTAQVTITLSPRAIAFLLLGLFRFRGLAVAAVAVAGVLAGGAAGFNGVLYVERDLAEQARELLLIAGRQFLERVMQEVPRRDARLLRHLAPGRREPDDPD